MESSLSKRIKSALDARKKKRQRKFVLGGAAAAVLVVTSVVMSLPAITATPELICGLEEHAHTDACYTEEKTLICTLEESAGHTHTDACYTAETSLVCGQQEYAGHTHTDACYTAQTSLVCGQQERAGHTHDGSCYDEEGNLICGQAEDPGHMHGDSCYHTDYVLTCGQAEDPGHAHSDSCYHTDYVLTCGQTEEPGHTHDDSCYLTIEGLTCGKEEHVHTAECYEQSGMLKSQAGDRMAAEVYYEAGVLHDGSALSAKVLQNKDAKDAETCIENLLNRENKTAQVIRSYDLSVSRNGRQVQPDGNVDVRLTFDQTVRAEENNVEWRLFHIYDDGSVKELTKDNYTFIKTNNQNEVEELSFRTDSFSWYVLAGVVEKTAGTEAKVETEAVIETEVQIAETEEVVVLTEGAKEEAEEAITQTDAVEEETEEVVFETEAVTEAETAAETETEEETVAETEMESETEFETETETETDTEDTYPASEFTGRANGVKVFVSADQGAFPEGTIMRVTGVLDTSVLEEAIAAAGTENAKAKAVDISFYDAEGNSIEPAKAIRVTMQADVVAATEEITVVHVDDENKAEVVEQTSEKELNSEETIAEDQVVFDADAFSAYVLVYTVDFSYGEYAYSIEGGSSILLSDLMEILHIYNEEKELLTVADVRNVKFSDESLVEITEENGDWRLISLKAFSSSESLILTLTDDSEITIIVTDSKTVTDLNDYVTSVEITGATKTDTGYEVHAGDPYSIKVTFEETNDTQFSTDGSLTYQLPQGVTVGEVQRGTGQVKVYINDTESYVPYTYTIGTDGKVIITWPTDHSDHQAEWTELLNSQYMELEVDLTAVFQSNASEIEFHAGTDGKVTIDHDHDLSVIKYGNYNAQTNQVDYTITVTSTGHNTNINVTDVISGTALTYRSDTFRSENLSTKVTHNANGFTYHVDSMNNGESFKIYYSADVNLDGIKKGEDGNYNGTFDETGNTVTVKGDDIPTPPTDKKEGKDFNNKISYSTLNKNASAEVADTDDELVKRVTWTIKANENANVSMAGKKITDTIADDSKSIMHYSGTGITVTVKDKSGNEVAGSPRTVSWAELGMTGETDSDWVYTVPTTDGNYSYEITYTTDVTVSETDSTIVKNGVDDGNGNHSDGSKTIKPTAGETTIKKEYTNVDTTNNEITWKITLQVPSVGYDKYSVKDFYPNEYDSTINGQRYFTYKDGSIQVDGLEETESYALDSTNEEYLLITFYKDKVGTNTGLVSVDNPRKITITITTKMSDLFVNNASASEGITWVNNIAHAYADDKDIKDDADAPVQYSKRTISKTNDKSIDYNTVDGVSLPMIRYDVVITGVSDSVFDESGKLILTDTFDSEHFTWLHVTKNDGGGTENNFNGWVYGGENNQYAYNQENKSSEQVISVVDGKLLITLDKNKLPRKSGEYFYRYTIPYYLTVKDEAALEALNNAAGSNSGGIYSIKNKVENEKFGSDETNFEYTTDILTKSATTPSYNVETGNYVVEYTLNLNPLAQQLGTGNNLELVDESENLTIDLSSIEATPSLGVSWNRNSNNKLVFTIPNATNVQITYRAKIVGTGTVTYSNKATLHGQEKTTRDSCNVSSHSEGSAVTYKMKILKHEAGDIMATLEGVEFDLYMLRESTKSNSPSKDGKDNMPDEADPRWVEIDTDGTDPFVTNDDGLIEINAETMKAHDKQDVHEGKGLYHSTWYMLKEHSAPVVNGVEYQLDIAAHMFWIDPTAAADYEKSVYVNDDIITISNTPTDNTKIGFTIKKLWEGEDAANLPESITIHLMQKDSIYADNNTATQVKEVTLFKSDYASDSLEWTYEFKDLEKGKAYYIVEDDVPGFTTVYEDENTIGYTRNGIITLTNKADTKIDVSKKWVKSDGTTPVSDQSLLPESITIRLYQDGKEYETYTVEKSKNWQLSIAGLPIDHEYTIIEVVPDGFEQVSLTYSEDGKTAEVTNRIISEKPSESTTQISVKKKWLNIDDSEVTDSSELKNLFATMELTRYKKEVNGTILHFWYWDGSEYAKLADDIIVEQSANVVVNFHNLGWTSLFEYNTSLAGVKNQWIDATQSYNIEAANSEQTVFKSTISTTGKSEMHLFFKQVATSATTLEVVSGVANVDDSVGVKDASFSRTIKLSSNNNWSSTFSQLPRVQAEADGKLYSYTYMLTEKEASDGYSFASYEIEGAEVVTNQEDGMLVTDTSKVITVNNKKQETAIDFRFTKIWKDINDTEILWTDNQSITVTLTGTFTPTNGENSTQNWTYTITKSGDQYNVIKQSDANPDMAVEQNTTDKTKYKFTISDLPETGTYNGNLGTWTYTLTESTVEGYETQYYSTDQNGSLITGAAGDKTNISSDEAIVNKQVAYYELPNTGGTGTLKYILSGFSLMIIALLLFIKRKSLEGRTV